MSLHQEQMGQPIGLCIEFAISNNLPLVADRRCRGGAHHLRLEKLMQANSPQFGHDRPTARGYDLRDLRCREEGQGGNRLRRLGNNGPEQGLELFDHLHHRLTFKEVSAILPGDPQRLTIFGDGEHQIILDGRFLPGHWR